MRVLLLAFSALALSACSADVRERSLADVDLGNMEVVQALGTELSQDERAALATYVVAHWPRSAAFCGEVLVDENGQQPTTIGEAIVMTKWREKERERRLARAARPRTPMEQLLDRRDFLIGQQDQLFSQKELLFDQLGKKAMTHPHMDAIEGELEASFAQTVQLNKEIEQRRRDQAVSHEAKSGA